ncbi:MAG: hypothetical protein AAFY64_09505, partial [Pseudomonadota bacterium]
MALKDDLKSTLGRARAAAAKLPVKTAAETAKRARAGAAAKIAHWPRGRIIGGAIALAIVLFLSANVVASNVFQTARADLTESNLYSLTDGT